MLERETLDPTTTFELRFDEPVVDSSQVGMAATLSPLSIRPRLPGRFVWLSQRSGVFTPTQPPALGTTYELSLQPGLRRSDGQSVHAQLHRRFSTPPFEVTAYEPAESAFNRTNAPCQPQFQLQFNATVQAQSARPFIEFRDNSGASVAAQVIQATTTNYFSTGGTDQNGTDLSLTWRERFWAHQKAVSAPRLGPASAHSEEAPAAPAPVHNRLMVSPAVPLPIGQGWKLVVNRGLPASEGHLRLAGPCIVKIGTVAPFGLVEAEAHNGLQSGKRLQLSFNKPLSPDISSTNVSQWISVTPAPTNLTASVGGSSVELHGNFQLDQPYSLAIRPGLPAAEPFVLGQAVKQQVVFYPLPPRLYFPSFSSDQLSAGRRQIELLALNVSASIRVRAKLLDRHTLIHALRGYRSYFKPRRNETDAPFGEVDFNVVPGKSIFETYLATNAPPDEAARFTLGWSQVLGGRTHGAVFLAAGYDDLTGPSHTGLGTETLIQLTDLGMVWKNSANELNVYAFSYTSGLPLSGAIVRLLNEDNEFLAEQTTDAQGRAFFKRLPNIDWGACWLMAEKGEDLHAMNLGERWEHQLPLYGFNLPLDWGGDNADRRKVMLFSDRPVYRPGEVLQLKGLVRDWHKEQFTIPAGLQGRLEGIDARDRKFVETNVTFSSLGSITVSLPLPRNVRGPYRAELCLTNQTTNEIRYIYYFQVQEYQPNAFEVNLKCPPAFAASEPVAIPVSAKYLWGQSLSRAVLRWSIEAQDAGFAPGGFDDFWFTDHAQRYDMDRESAAYAAQGETNYTSKGALSLAPEIPINHQAPQPRSVHLLIETTDLNQQTVSQSAHFLRHSSDFYLGLKRLKDVVREGQSLPLQLVAVRADGQPYQTRLSAEVRVQKIEWQTVRVLAAGGAITYRNTWDLKPVAEQQVMTRPVQRVGTKWELVEDSDVATNSTEAVAASTPAIRLAEAGLYLIEAKAKDPGGREIVTAATINVFGRKDLAWNFRNETQIDLIPDQPVYQVGQTATILVKTPFSGNALVTIEREEVMESYVTNLVGHAPALRVPLTSAHVPNVYVSVLLLRGLDASPRQIKVPEYRLGYCALQVENPAQKLAVIITPSATDYRPGQTVSLTAEVHNYEERPVAGAEVTLYAVDEGVLSLMGYDSPDPYEFFYAPRPLGVWTSSSFPNLLPEDPAQLRFGNKGYVIGGGGRAAERLRHNFLACAFWSANLHTDSQGRLVASFTAPDSLTRYRLIAVAQTASSQFGTGESALEINKPLMVEPALPRFANVGDQIIARAVVHNQTAQPGQIEVTLGLDDKAMSAPSLDAISRNSALSSSATPDISATTNSIVAHSLLLVPHTSGTLEFPLKLIEAGPASWIWRTRFISSQAGDFADTVQSDLEVGFPAPSLRETYLSHTEATSTNLLVGINPQLLEGKGTATVQVANSRLLQLDGAVSHLFHYPYGCIEQTVSTLLPWLVLREFFPVLPQLRKSPAEVQATVKRGIERILSMQTSSGGLAYWPGGHEPNLWCSAYGELALALAQRYDYSIPDGSMNRLTNYLSSALRNSGTLLYNDELADRCLAVYALALAGRAEHSYHELLYQKRDSLTAESRALLALAILESNGPAAMADELLNPKKPLPAQGDLWFSCAARELATRLLAWCRLRPADPQVDILVAELLRSQRDAHWYTTQGDAWGVYALAEYARRVESSVRAAAGSLDWGQRKEAFRFDEKPAVFSAVFGLPPSAAQAPLTLSNPESRKLFAELTFEARPRVSQQPRQDRGFGLQRSYAVVADDGTLQELKQPRVGDRVLINLRLEVRQAAHYVAVDDPWPAVFEGVNPEFKSQETRAGASLEPDWVSDFREFRSDRALFFRDFLPPGTYTIRYLARVRAVGSATAPSAKVEEMYHPERLGLTETMVVTSLPME